MTRSNIEWTDATWNPVVGCTRVSSACDHCYAVKMSHRLGAMADADEARGDDPGRKAVYRGLTVLNPKGDRHFNGEVRCVPAALGDPLRWRKPRMVFTASMSDIFHERVPFEFLDRIFAVMALTPQHTYQVLTKRPERMAEYLQRKDGNGYDTPKRVEFYMVGQKGCPDRFSIDWPLPNVWLGTTVEDQARADERIPHLLRCPAAVRFVSCEPLLGELDLTGGPRGHGPGWLNCYVPDDAKRTRPERWRGPFIYSAATCGIHWVIAGGETAAADAVRFTDDAWLRSLRDQCAAAGVPFFLKQRTERGRKVALERWPDDLRVREWPAAAREATP